jgi:hypothetical protein
MADENAKHSSDGTLVGIIAIIIGISVLGALYLFPFVTILGSSFSIAQLNTYCSNSLINAVFSANCNQYSFYFYGGWVVSGLLLIAGIYKIYSSKK